MRVLRVAIVLAVVSGAGILACVALLALGLAGAEGDAGRPPVESPESISRELADWKAKDVHAFWLGPSPAGRRLSGAGRAREGGYPFALLHYGDCVEIDPGSGCIWEVQITTGTGPYRDYFAEKRYLFTHERNVSGRRFGVLEGGGTAVMRIKGLEVIIDSREAPVDRWLRFVRPVR
jgi:hypothetical protein